jgi:hypothetical protein
MWLLCGKREIDNNKYKTEYNDHRRDPKIVAVVDKGFLFRGSFVL